ncbi:MULTISPECIES: hypothetical protein [Mesonia]|uniref:Uncharacterized protein n=1 Tax=Mesonia oceanica TaxID=2687242 RepID=A0AC61Y962_9FLAO|nr:MULTISPECIES: hypothetical protein [Mesonia]MAN27500.1 hypothetical protein [Mesonia sp.]MAQ40581.1 hypothetical protein [Mesonia sp.]VVV01037.1 hypothetical protein FVB9532_02315 [Mesonia oceanica]|tara:strand:+ start:6079 stop:6837 length:759 start_codon:yes stop_codon:yes gene_type:complete
MKKTLLLLLLVFGIKSSFAECAMSGMSFFPETKEISLNSMFIIQGYALSQKTIESFNERTIYLKSEDGELIELNLQEILTGQLQLTQAIFCPSSELKPNTKYFLNYSEKTENKINGISTYNRDKEESEKVYWKTTDKKSIGNLNPNLSLEFEKTEVIPYGCGPEANAIFKIKNKSDAEIWYKTEVIELATNHKSIYYIKERDGKLNVGHGMCAGAFTFKNKGKYKVRFTPMNIDGEKLKTTDWITFESPFVY